MSVSNKIVFPHKHPLFKKKETKRGVYFENSIYFFWFEFLKLNEKYIAACKNKGRGMKKIYEDFGDIRKKTFKQWWNEKYKGTTRGVYLFSNYLSLEKVIKISNKNNLNYLKANNYTLFAVPKFMDINFSLKEIRNILKKDRIKIIYKSRYFLKTKTFKIKSLSNYLKFIKNCNNGYKNWESVAIVKELDIKNIDKKLKPHLNFLANKWQKNIFNFYKNIFLNN